MTTNNRAIILVVILIILSLKSIAQNSFLEINKTDNSVYRLELSILNKITFSGSDMKINLISGEINTISTKAIRTMMFKNSTGLHVNQQGNQIRIYPSPATEYIRFKGLKSENSLITIFSVTGQLVMSQSLNSSEETLSIVNLQPGIYFVNIENQLIRFIKQ